MIQVSLSMLPRGVKPQAQRVRFGMDWDQAVRQVFPGLTERFSHAYQFAQSLHSTQFRKGTDIPYIEHLKAVAHIVLRYGGTEDEAIAGLLHDAIEDQAQTYPGKAPALRAEIERRYGRAVLEIVNGCTDAEVIPKPPWRERKQAYIDHVKTASPSVRKVSAADKLHNASSIVEDIKQIGVEQTFAKFKGGLDGTLWYYRSLVDVFKTFGRSQLVEALDKSVTEMEKLAKPKA